MTRSSRSPKPVPKRWYHYSLYGLGLRSDSPFPEWSRVELKKAPRGPQVIFQQGVGVPKGLPAGRQVNCHQRGHSSEGNGRNFQGLTYSWRGDHQTALVGSRSAGHFRIHLDEKKIQWSPSPESSPGLARVVFRGRILGLLLSALPFYLVLHGNLLKVRGKCIALCGGFRQGKSTLSSWLLAKGALLHSDDTAALRYDRGTFWAESGPPEIRLWSRSAFLLEPLGLPAEPLFHETKKKRFLLSAAHSSAFDRRPAKLRTLYVLSRRRRGKIGIETLNPQDGLTAILQNHYLPVFRNPKILARQFRLAARLAETVTVKRLTYPSGLRRLDEVGNALKHDLHTK